MKPFIRSIAFGLGILSLLACASVARTQTFKGTLNADKKKEAHTMKMKKGTAYQISMTSKAFDTFLVLEDPNGKQIAKNDDIAPTNLNSRIFVVAKTTGNYKVVATSFGGQGKGAYTIDVNVMTKVGKLKQNKGKLDKNSPLFKNKFRYQGFKVKMAAGKTYRIDAMSSDFDTVLLIRQPNSDRPLTGDDDGGEGTNSRLLFSPEKSGTFEIIVAPFSGNVTGNFTMSIQEYKLSKK